MNTLASWLVAYMMSKSAEHPVSYYAEIARDIVAVVKEEPPLFKGPDGKVKTALVLATTMWYEGGFSPRIDHQESRHSAVCLMQVNVGRGLTWEGWTARQLLGDRRKCLVAGLHIAQKSFELCQHLPEQDRLRAYASGSCKKGKRQSRQRITEMYRWYYANPPTIHDNVFLEMSVRNPPHQKVN